MEKSNPRVEGRGERCGGGGGADLGITRVSLSIRAHASAPVPVHRALKAQLTSPLTSQHEHRTSTTVDELRQVIDHTAPVVAYNGHATTSPELNEAAVGARLSSPRQHQRTAGPATFTYKTCEIRPKASKTDTDMYPLSNQRVLNT